MPVSHTNIEGVLRYEVVQVGDKNGRYTSDTTLPQIFMYDTIYRGDT
jgi:hypothetical protein